MRFKNKLLILITTIALACASVVPAFAVSADEAAKDGFTIEAEAAIVMDAETGEILYEKDAYSKREPASVTKIITCLVALDYLDMNQKITAKSDGTDMGSVIGIKAGEEFTAEQLLYALMLPSANDAAVALAEEIGGSVENFCVMMDQKAADCGAKNTHFRNPNGLNWAGQEDHLTTAYDLAVITREALKNEDFRKIISTLNYEIPATNKSQARKLINTNKFLWDDKTIEWATAEASKDPEPEEVYVPPYHEGVLGVKTGLTSTAGACFVGAINCNGTELITVVLNSSEDGRFADTAALWDYAIEKFYDTHVMMAEGETADKVRVKKGAVRKVEAVAEKDASITVPSGESVKKAKVKVETDKLEAPVEKGQVIGTVSVYNGDELVSQRNLLAKESVEEGGFLANFGIPDKAAPFVYALLILLIGLIIYSRKKTQEKRRRRKARKAKRQRKEA